MEVAVNDEVLQWAAAGEVLDLLPKLANEGYLTLSSVCRIEKDDLVAMGITKRGDQVRVLLAVEQACASKAVPPGASPPDVRLMKEQLQGLQTGVEGLQTGFKELAIKQSKDRSDRSAPSTFAERYERLSRKPATEAWFRVAPQRPTFLGPRGKLRYIFPESGGYPAKGADESKTVQPYWSTKLEELSKTTGLAVVLHDTHRSVSYGNRKPDVVGYQADKPRCVFYIALVGDVKARRQANKESFDASEKGHLESFLEDLLLEFQPYRQAVNGFLTDGCLIQFFRLKRLESELLWIEGPVLHLHNGGDKWLLGLLQDEDAHGLPANITIDQTPVIMNKLLGIGGSSVVYSGVRQGAEVVVKLSSARKLHHLEQEATILSRISDMVPRVPRLIARDDTIPVLLLQPVGVQFASRLSHFTQPTIDRPTVATADDFCQLVDILQTVHKRYSLVHRDVRLPNFFRHQESGMVFLNDWGSATDVGKDVFFSGALQHAPHRVLRSRIGARRATYVPRFGDDLEMVVRSVFHSLSMTTFEEIRLEEDEAKLISFWERHLAPAIWAAMVAVAQHEDYDSLKAHIRNLLPSRS